METTKNKDVLRNLWEALTKSDRHAKGKQKTKQKPYQREFKTDLSEQIEFTSGIIPNAEVQDAIDKQADEKFRGNDACRTKQATEKKRATTKPAIQKKDHGKTKAACKYHGIMCKPPP